MVKRKLSRKELKQDEVLGFFQKLVHQFSKYQKHLLYGGVSLVTVAVIIWGAVSFHQSRERHAAELFASALKEDTVDQDVLSRVASKYKSTHAGRSASLMLSLREEGTPEDTVQKLESLLPKFHDPALKAAAYRDVVAMMMNEKKFEEAISFVDGSGDEVGADLKLFLKGRIEEARGRSEEARLLYDELNETHSESPYAALARTRAQYL
ncbi:MAG TPA: tetratricopeptide repeat protein [Thermoanaerobaculia bacterium]|nr:tetratricopeptide repeat protein [Thermoanaerobaculia bacterium]HUM30910.1 tetratricopeptide repeat protein [Thermoanaerobaculia bacterium]HXK69220.1 tetratricopeptide repeat protein [Thermoanaerobaculia bacterium]